MVNWGVSGANAPLIGLSPGNTVIPAKAGISGKGREIPAFAEMTEGQVKGARV